MYDLNVLTVDAAGMIAQLDRIKAEAEAASFLARYIEFGNEFFIASHYDTFFSTASEYIQKVRPGLVYARQLFPEAKLALPAGYHFCSHNQYEFLAWNTQLAENVALYDAVTIREYTAYTKSVDAGGESNHNGREYTVDQRRSVLAVWGEIALGKHADWVGSFFS
jgi:hypothetical protein